MSSHKHDKNEKHSAALQALAQCMAPLAEILLDLGITSREAESVLRDAYVTTAREKLSKQSKKKVSLSLIALKCGLDRAETRRRLLGAAGSEQQVGAPDLHRLNRLLEGWHTDPDYVSAEGEPRPIAYSGELSFESLVSQYAASLYPSVILAELIRVGAVARNSEGLLEPLRRHYFSQDLDERALAEFARQGRDALATLVNSIKAADNAPVVAQAMAFQVDPRFSGLLLRVVRERAEAFVRLLDEELNAPDVSVPGEGDRVGLLVIGVHEARPPHQVSGESPRTTRLRRKGRGSGRQ